MNYLELLNKKIQGNSIELFESFPDKCVDMIFTDVPYDFTQDVKQYVHNQFLRISKGWIIVFSPPENQWILPADQYGFWIKPISTKNTSKSYSRFVEMLFFYGSGTWNTHRHWSQYTNVFTDLVDEKHHEYRKPPSLIERIIQNHTNESDIIFDPFAGSYTIHDIALKLNRLCISIDINERGQEIKL